MARVLTFGGIDLLAGGLKVQPGGFRQTRSRDGHVIETYRLVATSASEATIVDAFDQIDDKIKEAFEYVDNPLQKDPVYLAENVDGETAKQAMVFGGSLEAVSGANLDKMLKFDGVYAILSIERGTWEATAAAEWLSDTFVFDWSTAYYATTAIIGSVDARMDITKLASTSNTSAAPITEGWIGIREEYQGITGFNPIWEAEFGDLNSGTASDAALADGDTNTSPTGTTGNMVAISFSGETGPAERFQVSLAQQVTGDTVNNAVTNGGAETGTTTGWSSSGSWSASTLSPQTGTYNFLGNFTIGNGGNFSQDISVTDLEQIEWSYSVKVTNYDSEGQIGSFVGVYNSDSALIQVMDWRTYSSTQDYTTYSGTLTVPQNSSFVRFLFQVNPGLGTQTIIMDDIIVYKLLSENWVGKYQVLGRFYNSVTSGITWPQIRFGYGGSTNKQPFREVKVASTAWMLYPMGEVSFPPGRTTVDDNQSLRRLNNLALEVWARQGVAGTTLNCDGFIFIPSEHMIYFNDVQIAKTVILGDTTGTEALSKFYIYSLTEGRVEGIADGPNLSVDQNIEFTPQVWQLPTGLNVVVVAGQRSNLHNLVDNISIDSTHLPRWKNYNDE